jgi:pilus assembly protein FimV
MKKSIQISGLLSALLFAWGGVHAAGLGKLSVQSALGQPLKAEIELLSVTKEELSGISARLANIELFRQARIERAGALGSLEFDVAQRANGQPVIRISSTAPLTDPFLDMLIELNWNTGRIIREYTILLDPPMDGRASAQSVPVKVASPSTSTAAPAKEAMKPTADAAKPTEKPAAKAAPSRYGPVKTGETLRAIAGRVKPAEVTLAQMMAGLYMTNKSAFIDSNMNLLKKGAVLSVPTAEAVHLQNSPAQAIRMIQNHVEEWHAYRSKVAEVAAEVPESKAEGQSAAGKITSKLEDKAAPATAPKDVLKLSKGEPAAAGKPDAKLLERMQSQEEELAAKSRALQESQERVNQLERAVRDMQQLLELKSQEAAKVTPPAPEAPAQAEQPAQPEPAAQPAPAAVPAAVPAVPPATEVEEKSWWSTFLNNPIYIGGLVAAGLLSGLLWMMMVGSRRRQNLNKFEDSIMTGGEFKSAAVFNTGGVATSTGNTEGSMLLTDFSRLGLGAIDTHEVDPIAEAEVYMAYGRDAQAEEILKEALDKDSSRHEVALKLLEIYAARKDPLAFETTASELYAGLGGQDTPVWQRAAEMGRSIDPENPLYRMAQGQSFAPLPEAGNKESEAPVDAVEQTPEASGDDLGLDFTSSFGVLPEGEASEQEEGLEFASSFDVAPLKEVAEGPAETEAATLAEPAAESLAMDDFSMEFASLDAEDEQAEPEIDDVLVAPELPVDLGDWEESAQDVTAEMAEVPEFQVEIESPEEADEGIHEVIELDLPAETLAEDKTEEFPELDFTSIDLDLETETPVEGVMEVEDEMPSDLEGETALETPEVPEVEVAAVEELAVEEAVPAPAPAAGIDPALWEEVNTKLDLARAYLEMGDREGAREILQEVVQEGDDDQKADAQQLIAEAG